jgi:hypothetical protein
LLRGGRASPAVQLRDIESLPPQSHSVLAEALAERCLDYTTAEQTHAKKVL